MSAAEAKPFLKWAGGKGHLLPELMARLPDQFKTYHEPFLGGGALFFKLFSAGRLTRAILSDMNEPLIDTYLAIQKDVNRVIRRLKKHKNEKEYYYRVRAMNPRRMSLSGRAARLIYMNRTCFNGLYRENSSGQFNVPFGSYKNPRICDEENLVAVFEALKKARILCGHFSGVWDRAEPEDFVYFDPPYHPVSKTSSFTAYDRSGFTESDQEELRDVFGELAIRGTYVMLSNSDTPLIRKLYRDYRIEQVHAPRRINSRGDRRGNIPELIICSY